MIDLQKATVVGSGCRRVVYVHPDDPARCIKVPTAEAREQVHRQKALERELHYLQFYARKGKSLGQLSRYFGEVETRDGVGYVFELVRDHNGEVSRNLAEWLEAGLGLDECRSELEELRQYLVAEGIIVADLHAGNLARQERQPGVFRLVVIDGVGNSEFLKVNDYLRIAARGKVARKWSRFMVQFEREWG